MFPPSLQVLLHKLTNAEDIEKTLRKQLDRKDQEIVALEGKYADLGAKHERVADDHHLTKETIAESNEHAVNLDKQILQKDEKIETLQKKLKQAKQDLVEGTTGDEREKLELQEQLQEVQKRLSKDGKAMASEIAKLETQKTTLGLTPF